MMLHPPPCEDSIQRSSISKGEDRLHDRPQSRGEARSSVRVAANNHRCICEREYNPNEPYIACDSCDVWHHLSCVNLIRADTATMDAWFCPRPECRQQRLRHEATTAPPSAMGDAANGKPASAAPAVPCTVIPVKLKRKHIAISELVASAVKATKHGSNIYSQNQLMVPKPLAVPALIRREGYKPQPPPDTSMLTAAEYYEASNPSAPYHSAANPAAVNANPSCLAPPAHLKEWARHPRELQPDPAPPSAAMPPRPEMEHKQRLSHILHKLRDENADLLSQLNQKQRTVGPDTAAQQCSELQQLASNAISQSRNVRASISRATAAPPPAAVAAPPPPPSWYENPPTSGVAEQRARPSSPEEPTLTLEHLIRTATDNDKADHIMTVLHAHDVSAMHLIHGLGFNSRNGATVVRCEAVVAELARESENGKPSMKMECANLLVSTICNLTEDGMRMLRNSFEGITTSGKPPGIKRFPGDAYKWCKYGQKVLTGRTDSRGHHREYFRCADRNCNAKKQVQVDPVTRNIINESSTPHNHPGPDDSPPKASDDPGHNILS